MLSKSVNRPQTLESHWSSSVTTLWSTWNKEPQQGYTTFVSVVQDVTTTKFLLNTPRWDFYRQHLWKVLKFWGVQTRVCGSKGRERQSCVEIHNKPLNGEDFRMLFCL